MPIYASDSDFTAWIAPATIPTNSATLLRAASYRITDAVKTAIFDVNPAGLPVDLDIRNALRDATTAQAAVWAALGNTPGLGGLDSKAATRAKRVGSMSIDIDTSIASSVSASEQRRALVDGPLCPDAVMILDQAGLLSGPIVSYG